MESAFFPLFFVVVLLALAAVPVLLLTRIARNRSRLRQWTATTATLTQQPELDEAGRHGPDRLVVHYAYADTNGQQRVGTERLRENFPAGEAGSPLDIVVDPTDPSRSAVVDPNPRGTGCLVVVATVWALGCLGLAAVFLSSALR